MIEKLFFNILTYSFLLPPIAIILVWNKVSYNYTYKKILAAIFTYCLTFFFFLFFSDYFSEHYAKIYVTIYTSLEYLFFTFIIWNFIINNNMKRIILVLSGLFLLFQTYYFFTSKINLLDSIPIGIETILILFYIVFCFYEQFKITTSEFAYKKYWFWVTIGILAYLSCSFFFNIMANSVQYKLLQPYWFVTYVFEIIKNLLFLVAIYLISKNKNNNHKHSNIPLLDMI